MLSTDKEEPLNEIPHRKTSVFLVDDHHIIKSGIRTELSNSDTLVFSGDASTGAEALEKIIKLRPDIVLMDITLPDYNGIELTERLKQAIPGLKVIAFTMHDDNKYIWGMTEAGVHGYILKNTSECEILNAIKIVAEGKKYYSPAVVEAMLNRNSREFSSKTAESNNDDELLTQRENQILQLLAKGLTNKEIADKIFLSIRTVETHRMHIMQKLNVDNFAELVKYAISKGII